MGIFMKANFVLWTAKDLPNACCLHQLKGVDDTFELVEGIPRVANFPADATYPMHPDFPHDTLLTDNLLNTDRLIVASRRLKEFLESQALTHVEYLPVTILNHKNRPASKDYFIVHPIDPIECLDEKASGAQRSNIDTDTIQKLKRLVIDEAKIEPTRSLFRAKHFPKVIFVRRTLADTIDATNFAGIRWMELDEFKR
jgi:hypothetical protein